MKKKEIKSFNEIPAYRAFVNDRDSALEEILKNTRLRVSDQLNGAFNSAFDLIKREYKQLSSLYHPVPQKPRFAMFEKRLNDLFEAYAVQIASIIFDQRRKAYVLSHAGEAKAISLVTKKTMKIDASKHSLDQWVYSEPFLDGMSVMKKVDVYFNKLRRVIMNEIELSTAMDEPLEVCFGRILKKLPRKLPIDQARKLKKVPRQIPKKMKEAAFQFGMMDDSAWQDAVDDYASEYQPVNRSPDYSFNAVDPTTGETVPPSTKLTDDQYYYGWEVERDTTHDFVKQVRDGQKDAANENGITDFVVIAVLDDRTCEHCCGDHGCYDFNGRTTSEIESMTAGEYSAPPYHFNCRCTLAPYTPDMQSYDISQTEGDFESWLNQP